MPHQRLTSAPPTPPGLAEPERPIVVRTSAHLGWGDMGAFVWYMPAHVDSFRPAPPPGICVSLLLHGAVDFEQRPHYGAWQTLRIPAGTISLHDNGEPWEFRWRRRSAERVDALRLWLSSELIAGAAANVTNHDPCAVTVRQELGAYDPVLLQLGLALQGELEQPTLSGAVYAQTAAQFLAVHVVRRYSSLTTSLPEPTAGLTPRQLTRVREYVQANLTQSLTLADLAQHVNLSPYYFARLFRRATGDSPHQYVLRQRLERAQWLLKETDIPIAQVAAESGLASQTHLTALFTRRLGVTPRAYRRCTR